MPSFNAGKRTYIFLPEEDSLMPVSAFSKYVSESFMIRMDFTNRMPTGKILAVSGSTVRAINIATDVDDAATVLDSATPTLDTVNNLADVIVKAGVKGSKYRLEFEIGLDADGPIEDHLMMEVV